eukprot:jgi/Mesen1/2191/ME000152S01274
MRRAIFFGNMASRGMCQQLRAAAAAAPMMLVCLLFCMPSGSRALPRTGRAGTLIGYREAGRVQHDAPSGASAGQQVSAGDSGGDSGGDSVTVQSYYGDIKVRLRADKSPKTVAYVKELIATGVYKGCSLYRAEPPGPTRDDGHSETREGYALVQGGAYNCGRQQEHKLPVEFDLPVTTWSPLCQVADAQGTSEFFFSLGDHSEWNGAFSVWGEVADEESRSVLRTIVGLPTKQESHPTGTVLRILVEPVPFDMHL